MAHSVWKHYETCDEIVKKLLQYCPIWRESKIQRSLKIFLQFYAIIVSTLVSYSIFVAASSASDVTSVTEYLASGIGLMILPVKLAPTVICKDTFMEIYEQLDMDLRNYCNDTAMITMEMATLKLFGSAMKFYVICYRLLVLNYVIIPLMFMIYQISFNIRPIILMFPYPGSYPDNFTKTY
ncbi:uncharacterized protein [Fopius arisanus]|uniref:Uncharacterized protein n=1 Tax=Fopius arisanus TaxID=64838 RepID=A0A9R1TEM6_9HYME|nr:PREDICTED: uncharacterized protein LOC105269294 [Fopius arisanus]